MDEPVVLWWQPAGGAPRTVFGSREAYPAMVFEQVHPEMGDAVRAFAVEALGSVAGLRVWDLYAGIGETSRALAARGATVESIELDRRAVDLANSLGGERMIRHAGPVEERLPALAPADAAIVNPPRVGLSAEVAEMLVTRAPRRLVYISCDPATLARDLTRLSAGYRVVDVRAFDLFPQTAHVETVTLLESAS
ncbi:MAG: hypothetical protein HOP28_08715 [Gemmatimonadales bacterium]|nr:hypothetical protein [Gemmatimonadales bacterium]